MTVKEKYDQELKPDIKSFFDQIEIRLQDGDIRDDIKSSYLGYRVFYSPLCHKPKVLFIGINPGSGQTCVKDSEYYADDRELEYLHYWDDNGEPHVSNYTLATETKKVFEKAGLSSLLQSAVKTNFFFIITNNVTGLYKITDFLGRGYDDNREIRLGEKIFKKAEEWTKKLIQFIEPELIICEGKSAFDNVTNLFLPIENKIIWKNDCAITSVPKYGLNIIGYKRNRSRIRNKEELTYLLKSFFRR